MSRRTLIAVVSSGLLLTYIVLSYFGADVSKPVPGPGHKNSRKKVLLWTKVSGSQPNILSPNADQSRCEATYDRSELRNADAVVFHEDDAFHEPPNATAFVGQRFIFWTMESVTSLSREGFMTVYPENYFHMVLSYVSASHASIPYGGYGSRPPPFSTPRTLTPLSEDDVYKDKTVEGIFWLVSNCYAASGRQHAVHAMSRHIRVDVAGECATDAALKSVCPQGDACEHVFKRYYFYTAMENSLCTDYITEKLWSRIHLPLIPIVLRREDYEKHAPPRSFIAIDDFDGPRDLAEYLHYLIKNRTAYMDYFRWRSASPPPVVWTWGKAFDAAFFALCDALWSVESSRPSAIPRLKQWFEQNVVCSSMNRTVEWSNSLS